eukprot:682462_1
MICSNWKSLCDIVLAACDTSISFCYCNANLRTHLLCHNIGNTYGIMMCSVGCRSAEHISQPFMVFKCACATLPFFAGSSPKITHVLWYTITIAYIVGSPYISSSSSIIAYLNVIAVSHIKQT